MTEEYFRDPTPEEIAERESWEAGAYDREYAAVQRRRQDAYRAEADHLFFYSERGKGTKQAWIDKVAEIDARYPYPEKSKFVPVKAPDKVTEVAVEAPEEVTEPIAE